ncbi:MAG: nucleotidyl transferase AbiEii/AbiGii toxin family protein [Trichococcus sp.]
MITPIQVKQKIKNIQTKTGIPAQLLQRNFIMERFLFRLSQSAYKENFILKGGYLVGLFIGSEKRTTMDLDTTVRGFTLTTEKIKQVLTEIGQIETDDGITYDVLQIQDIREEDDYPGIRIALKGCVGGTMRVPFYLDITTGDAITPEATSIKQDSLLNLESFSILSYPLETVLAEKLQTILNRSIANTRARDYYDVYTLYLLKRNRIKLELLHEALLNTMKKRNTPNLLEDALAILKDIHNSPELERVWKSYEKKNSHYVDNLTFQDTLNAVDELVIALTQL